MGLAYLTESHQLIFWQRRHTYVVKVTDSDPLLDVAWQENNLLGVLIHEEEELDEVIRGHQVCVLFR